MTTVLLNWWSQLSGQWLHPNPSSSLNKTSAVPRCTNVTQPDQAVHPPLGRLLVLMSLVSAPRTIRLRAGWQIIFPLSHNPGKAINHHTGQWPAAPSQPPVAARVLPPTLIHNLSLRYPIHWPRERCYGDKDEFPGVRTYGVREPDETYDVYCYAEQMQGDLGLLLLLDTEAAKALIMPRLNNSKYRGKGPREETG